MSEPIRILFVDDEERILRSLALQFRREYEVLTESDPRRALERLKARMCRSSSATSACHR